MLRIYNTLAKKVEEIQPATPGIIQMYTCRPTVYRDAHIGNLRTYLMADWVRRSLIHSGMQVTHVKNITDVGHMRQEALETGGDRFGGGVDCLALINFFSACGERNGSRPIRPIPATSPKTARKKKAWCF